MGSMITLKSGEVRPVLDVDDALELVEEELGSEIAKLIRDEIQYLTEENFDLSQQLNDAYDDIYNRDDEDY